VVTGHSLSIETSRVDPIHRRKKQSIQIGRPDRPERVARGPIPVFGFREKRNKWRTVIVGYRSVVDCGDDTSSQGSGRRL